MRLVQAILTVVLAGAAANAAAVQPGNSGFEEVGPRGIPRGWTPAGSPGSVVAADQQVKRAGNASLRLENPTPGALNAVSEPVTLEVGKLYRLTGWIRTEKAFADPTSRYPTAVAATMTMQSFPFTNHAPVLGATREWAKSEVLFFATSRQDRVRLHLGLNGKASGKAWFDDVTIEQVQDIAEYIPIETVRWFGPAFRYTDKGWTFVHIEGKPYQRGYQYGYLLAKEISAYAEKVSIANDQEKPASAWQNLRTLTDALLLRKYDPEYLEEMKGIADGAAEGGALISKRAVDFLDIVTLNSVVDIGQMAEGLSRSSHPLSGRSFSAEEEEAKMADRLHKCSSFLANGPATRDGRIVFSQLFMWSGYTGVHWDVICDVVPESGHRLVYETFPGGIHSGADFYINDAGIMIGETTVAQTPFDSAGSPQSSRIRKAAQYGSNIDDVVRILTTENNGLYTNDWLIGDVKANEIAILLLGTKQHKLWRSSTAEFPGGTEGFYWSVNNAKDPEVRKEYMPDALNAPFDLTFSPSNRDLAFYDYYKKEKGSIDGISAVNLIASSPINRPHACDGKVTTSEMAEKLMFLAHYGKVTLREKFPDKNSRRMPDLPGALPHLTLGYSVVNPVFITEELKKRRPAAISETKTANDYSEVTNVYKFEKKLLWGNTVFPASDADNWFVSGTATYWRMLSGLPADLKAAAPALGDQLAELNCRLLYTTGREGTLAPLRAARVYDRYGNYLVPRIRGTYALHQLRLLLGNELFSKVMNGVHSEFREKPMDTAAFIARAEALAGRPLRAFVMQWLERDDLPAPVVKAQIARDGDAWKVVVDVSQTGKPYDFLTTFGIETEKGISWRLAHIEPGNSQLNWTVKEQPKRLIFNVSNDIPVTREAYNVLPNLFDDFRSLMVVYGTSRQIEAQHTLAFRYATLIADTFTETIPALHQDAEVTPADLEGHDVVILSVGMDNALAADLAGRLGITIGRNYFRWKGKTYGEAEDGLVAVFPSPWKPGGVVFLYLANSALELHQMTKIHVILPSWGIFKADQVVEKGFHPVKTFELELAPGS